MKTYGNFPQIVQEVIKLRVGSKYNPDTRFTAGELIGGFDWEESPEGYGFWDETFAGKYDLFTQKYLQPSVLLRKNQKVVCCVDGIFSTYYVRSIKSDEIVNCVYNLGDSIDYPLWKRYITSYDDVIQRAISASEQTLDLNIGDVVVVVSNKCPISDFCTYHHVGTEIIITNEIYQTINKRDGVMSIDYKESIVTYPMLKKLNNNNDIQTSVKPDQCGSGSTIPYIQSPKSCFAVASRLIGSTCSLGRSQKNISSNPLEGMEYQRHSSV